MVMLETNICIYILKDSPPEVKEQLKAHRQIALST